MRFLSSLALPLLLACSPSTNEPQLPNLAPARSVAEFESHLDQLRTALRIPAFSASITRGTSVVWSKGFGLADVEGSVAATPETEYHLASLTKPFASTVILQLVDEGKVSLDDPVSKFGITLASSGVIRVRHLLSHTSEGEPGARYAYNGDRFALLDSVIVRASGKTFAQQVAERILIPLRLQRTAPNPLAPASFAVMGFDRSEFMARMAKPYGPSGDAIVLSSYPTSFSTAAGMVSTALDMARYSIAMDTNAFLQPATKAWRGHQPLRRIATRFPMVSAGSPRVCRANASCGTTAIGRRIHPHCESAVTRPHVRDHANSDMLSRPTNLGAGDLMSSSLAREFLNAFVFGTATLP